METHCKKDEAFEVIRGEIRTGRVLRTVGAMEKLPGLLDSVHVDCQELHRIVLTTIEREHSGNPINAILKVLGLRIVHVGDTVEKIVPLRGAQAKMDQLLTVDRAELDAALTGISQALEEAERDAGESERGQEDKIRSLSAKLNGADRALSALQTEANNMEKTVLERIQYILSLHGPARDASEEAAHLCELLEDLNARAAWERAEGDPEEAEMFTVLKTDRLEGRRAKPCMLRDGEVLVKGLKFQMSQAD